MELAKLILEYVKALAWPITAIALGLVFRKSLVAILARLEKASLPGGVSLDFEKQIKQVQNLSEKLLEAPVAPPVQGSVQISPGDANKKMIALSLEPMKSGLEIEYFRNLAKIDTTLALAALRIELESLFKNMIAKTYGEDPSKIRTSVSAIAMTKALAENRLIPSDEADLASKILRVCNRAIHGKKVSQQDALVVIGAAEYIFDRYRIWLSTL